MFAACSILEPRCRPTVICLTTANWPRLSRSRARRGATTRQPLIPRPWQKSAGRTRVEPSLGRRPSWGGPSERYARVQGAEVRIERLVRDLVGIGFAVSGGHDGAGGFRKYAARTAQTESVLLGEQFEVRSDKTPAADLPCHACLSHDAAQAVGAMPVAQVVPLDAIDEVWTSTEFHREVAILAFHAEQAFAARDRDDGGLIDAGGRCAGGPGVASASGAESCDQRGQR